MCFCVLFCVQVAGAVQAAASGAPVAAEATAELPLLPAPAEGADGPPAGPASAVRVALRLREGDDPGTYLRTHLLAPLGARLPYAAVVDVARQLGAAVYPPAASGSVAAVARRGEAGRAWMRWLQVRERGLARLEMRPACGGYLTSRHTNPLSLPCRCASLGPPGNSSGVCAVPSHPGTPPFLAGTPAWTGRATAVHPYQTPLLKHEIPPAHPYLS